jgi:protein-arginine kinase activator protein McsA
MARKIGEPIQVYVNGQLVCTCQTTTMDKWDMTNHIPTLKQYLNEAIDNEEYENACQIRDRIKEHEEQ